MLKHLLRQFYLSKAERHGAAGLMLLALSAFITPEMYRLLRKPAETDFSVFAGQVEAYFSAAAIPAAETGKDADPALFHFDPNTADAETLTRLGLSSKVAATIVKYRERGGRFRKADDLQKIYTLPEEDFERLRPFVRIEPSTNGRSRPQESDQAARQPEPFPFDPNTASESDLLRLGLSRGLAARLLRYREKGGFFFDKAGFKKLYGLTEAEYTRLEPYIVIAKSEAVVRPVAYSGGGHAKVNAAVVIDINTATPDDWRQLPGIGAARAHKIVRYRDKLGGFTSAAQVAETYDLPDSVFQQIRPQLRVETPVYRKININAVSEAELRAHPYFNFKQAQLIVAYREQNGRFGSVDDIGRIAAFSDRQWLEKVKPYLKVSD